MKWLFPDMTTFIKQPFHIEAIDSIAFDSIETAIDTVDKAIRSKNRLPDTVYMAIYVSPISKLDKNQENLKIYYRIKEILLQHSITSQVVYKEHIFNKNFNFFYRILRLLF
jgi:hypothetical protein